MKQLIALLLILFVQTVSAQKIVSCPLAAAPPEIDGSGKDPAWQQTEAFPINFDNRNGQSIDPAGSVKLLVSGDRLYILAELADKELMNYSFRGGRDNIDWKHSFEIFLSPSDTSNKYYHFAIDPAGNLFDSIGTSTATDFDFDVKSAVTMHAEGWTAELSLPLKDLEVKTPVTTGMRLGLNLTRTTSGYQPTLTAWSPTSDTFHSRKHFGTLLVGSFAESARASLSALENEFAKYPNLAGIFKADKAKFAEAADRIGNAAEFTEFQGQLKALRIKVAAAGSGGDKFAVWQINPWQPPASDYFPLAVSGNNSYRLEGFKDEYLTQAFCIANPTDKPVRVRCVPSELFNMSTGDRHWPKQEITIRSLTEIAVRGNTTQRDALPEITKETILTLLPGTNEVIWVTVNNPKLSPGQWAFSLDFKPLVERQLSARVSFEVNVLPVAVPADCRMFSHTWARLNWEPTRSIGEDVCFQDLIEHHTNVIMTDPFGRDQGVAQLRDDKPLDMSGLKKKFQLFGPDSMYILGLRMSNLPKDFMTADDKPTQKFTDYLHAVYALMDECGIPRRNCTWYIEDEPSEKLAVDAARLARMMIEIMGDGNVSFFVTFYSKTSLKTLETLLPYVDTWCPSLSPGKEQMELIAKSPRKDLRFFGYGVYTRMHNPYWAYRLSPLRALQNGYIGVGFWSYSDALDDRWGSTWDDFDSPRNISDFAVIYEGRDYPVSSIRWEGWRQGLQDAARIKYLRKLVSELPDGPLKKDAAELAATATKRFLATSNAAAADQISGELFRYLQRILLEKKLITKENLILSPYAPAMVTGNGFCFPVIANGGLYFSGPNKIPFGSPGARLTDRSMNLAAGRASFGAKAVFVELNDSWPVDWVLLSGGDHVKCSYRDAKGQWVEVPESDRYPDIWDSWHAYKLNGTTAKSIKFDLLDEGTKNLGELEIIVRDKNITPWR